MQVDIGAESGADEGRYRRRQKGGSHGVRKGPWRAMAAAAGAFNE
ncbi:hypothetical protein [Paraburkholderia sp. MM5477-R1]